MQEKLEKFLFLRSCSMTCEHIRLPPSSLHSFCALVDRCQSYWKLNNLSSMDSSRTLALPHVIHRWQSFIYQV
jgi:hypothetical protein